jgi:ABC-type antimicrobial peptide transport system permease subunit
MAAQRFRRLLRPLCTEVEQSTCVVTGQEPNGIIDYARIDAVPEVLGGLLATLGLAVLSQLVVMSARRRRRDFAVLRALGLLRHQISSITAWQVSALAVIALAAGLPLGIAAGRRGWELFGGMLGVPANAITPVGLVLLAIPAVVMLVNAVAFWPGRRAARVKAADVLRTE